MLRTNTIYAIGMSSFIHDDLRNQRPGLLHQTGRCRPTGRSRCPTHAGPARIVQQSKQIRSRRSALSTRSGPNSSPWIHSRWRCCLPVARAKGWEVDAASHFCQDQGQSSSLQLQLGMGWGLGGYSPDQDLNSDWGIPDHSAVGSFSLSYRFRPKWSLRYSIMPMELNGSGGNLQNFGFGLVRAPR